MSDNKPTIIKSSNPKQGSETRSIGNPRPPRSTATPPKPK